MQVKIQYRSTAGDGYEDFNDSAMYSIAAGLNDLNNEIGFKLIVIEDGKTYQNIGCYLERTSDLGPATYEANRALESYPNAILEFPDETGLEITKVPLVGGLSWERFYRDRVDSQGTNADDKIVLSENNTTYSGNESIEFKLRFTPDSAVSPASPYYLERLFVGIAFHGDEAPQ